MREGRRVWPVTIVAIVASMTAGISAGVAYASGLEAESTLPGARSLTGVPAREEFRARVKRARLGSVELAYYERGSGPPLLLNIGSASTMSEWDPALLASLAARRRLIVYDYRGIGLSSRIPAKGLTIETLADDASALLDHLGIERADVLGWSLGGFVAQQIAIRHPERVRRLILAGTNPGGARTVFGPPYAQEIDSDPDATDEEILSVNFPRTREGRAAARAFLDRLEDAAETGESPLDFTVPRSGYRAQLGAEERWYESEANLERLSDLRIPVLVATGRRDLLTPLANSRLIASRIPGARLVAFSGAGHAFLFQDYPRFARLVEEFLHP